MASLPAVAMLDFLDRADVEEEILNGVATVKCFNVEHASQLSEQDISEVEGVLLWHVVKADKDLIDRMPRLKVISRVGMGYDNVDLKHCGKRGIYVNNVPDYGVDEVADSAMSHILNLLRKTHELAVAVNTSKEWNTRLASQLHARRLRGKTLGLVGFGKIGKATALRAKGFGLDILFYDPLLEDGIDKALGVKRANTLQELISSCDIISLHCWLDSSTKHLINEQSLSWLKSSGAWLVNTARGAIVDENALAAALRTGKLLGAAIDVVEVEPYPKGGVLFADVPNLVLTPHTAFYSDEGFLEMRTKAAMEVRRVLTGQKPRNVVNSNFFNLEEINQ